MKHLILILAALAVPLACDPNEAVELRELQAAEFQSVEYARKIIDACFVDEHPATLTLTTVPPVPGSPQEYTLAIESLAPAAEVACVAQILGDNQ